MAIFAELTTEAEALLKKAGQEIKTFVVDEVTKLIAYLRTNEPLVTKTLNLISDLESSTLSGSEKMAKVIADIEDEANTFISEGGVSGVVSRGVADLKAFGESVYADFVADVSKK